MKKVHRKIIVKSKCICHFLLIHYYRVSEELACTGIVHSVSNLTFNLSLHGHAVKFEMIAERTCASVSSRVRYANAAELENGNGHWLQVTKRKRI